MTSGIDKEKSAREASGTHVCARCAGQGPTCCRLEPGHEEYCFPLSRAERDRIMDHAPGNKGGFAQSPNTAAFVEGIKKLFPGEEDVVEELFPLTGFHLRLAVDEEGACAFLGPKGCVLPREARPYYCRLFPLWVSGRDLSLFTAEMCLVRREKRSLAGILAALGTTRGRVRELYGRLRLAWGMAPRPGLPRPMTIAKKKEK